MWKEFVSRGVGSQEVSSCSDWNGTKAEVVLRFEDERTVNVTQPQATNLTVRSFLAGATSLVNASLSPTPCSLLLSIPRNPPGYSRDFIDQ
jgi:hypothetical protein